MSGAELVFDTRQALRPIVETYGQLDTFWQDQDRSQVGSLESAQFLLSLQSWGTELRIDSQYTRPEGDQIVFGLSGTRDFICEVRCESFFQDDSHTAFGFLETLKQRLQMHSGQDALLAASLSLRGFGAGGAVNLNQPYDNRMRSIAVLELIMRVAFCTEEEPNDCWIQRILVSSEIADATGQVLPVPPNWDDHVIEV